MSTVYNFQQNFKSFRDFQQNFLISLKPIKFDILNDVSMPDMVIVSHIFAFGQIDISILNLIIQIAFIVLVLVLYQMHNKLKKHQKEVSKSKIHKNVNLKVDEENENGEQNQTIQKEKKVPEKLITIVSILIILVNTLFQSVIEALFSNYIHIKNGDSNYLYGFVTGISIIIAFFYLIALYGTLKEQIPKERNVVDEEGIKQEWNEATYQADIEKQNSPYKTMFKPYKSNYPYFEIVIMLVKAFQVFLTTVSLKQPYEDEEQESGNKYGANAIAIIGQLLPLLFIITKKPFNYDGENKVNMFLYIFNIIETILITVQGMDNTDDSLKNVIIWIIRILFYVVPISQALLYKKYGPKQSYNMSSGEKETLKKLEFTAIIELGHEEDPEPMRNWLVFNEDILNLSDVRNKIWHNYWNNSFQYLPQFSGEFQEEYNDLFQDKNFKLINKKYPYFKCDSQNITPQKRLVENRRIWNVLGEEYYRNALQIQNDTNYLMVRQNILLDVQDQDCHDGEKFGQLDLNNFPFVGLFSPDNSSDYKEYFKFEEFDQLAQINCTDHNITVLKMKRKCFRALNGNSVYYPYIGYNSEKKKVGSGRAAQEYTIHGFLSHSYGRATYGHTQISLVMTGGQGADVETKQQSGNSGTGVGVDNLKYENFPPQTHELMFQNKEGVVRPNLPKVYQRQQKQRKELADDYYLRQKALSYHFNVNVIDNIYLQEEILQKQLDVEQNESLSKLLQDPYSGTTYKKTLQLANSPERIYQHYFYSDIWKKNYDVKSLKKKQLILDPSMQDFIGYEEFKTQEEHEKKLIKLGLKAYSKITVFQKFFNDEIMENYFQKVNHFQQKFCEEFQKEIPLELVPNDKIIEYNQDPKTFYAVDEATEEEKDTFIESFQQNLPRLFSDLLQRTKNFWSQAENENRQQIRDYETKKRQTEDKIKQLERELQQAKQKLQQAQQKLRSAESNLNGLSHDDPQRSSAQSKVSSARSDVNSAEREVSRIERELEFQREVLANIIEVLKKINFNQRQYDTTLTMSNNLVQGGIQDYSEFVEFIGKNIYIALMQQQQNPVNHTKNQYSHLNIEK